MYIKRDIEDIIHRYANFPAIAILGPRQSGKTTLAQHVFNKHTYISFEDPEMLALATIDPKGFLQKYENEHGLILDEFQHAPHILSYLQLDIDAKDRPGYFILIGSQNFLMNEKITQSLAGRVGILTLLPLSINEYSRMQEHALADNKPGTTRLPYEPSEEPTFQGGYPRIYTKKIDPLEFYPPYIHTYVERDVRQLVNVGNLQTFKKFMSLCAGRVGQQLNVSDLATNCNINQKTVVEWLSILEASYIIYLLPPYFENFNKRVTKTPKIYFYDTGLACSLLGITQEKDLSLSVFRGPLFECFIITDLHKQYFNAGKTAPLYYWRDLNGRIEVDCVIRTGITENGAPKLVPLEIKSSERINQDFFDGINRWDEIAKMDPKDNYVIYGGTTSQQRDYGTVIGWREAGSLIARLLTNR